MAIVRKNVNHPPLHATSQRSGTPSAAIAHKVRSYKGTDTPEWRLKPKRSVAPL